MVRKQSHKTHRMIAQLKGPKPWHAEFRGVCPASLCVRSFHVLLASDSTTHTHLTVTSVIRGDQDQKRPTSKIPPPSRLVDLHVNELRCFFSSHSAYLSAPKVGEKLPRRRPSSSSLKTSPPFLNHPRLQSLLCSGVRILNHVSIFTTLPCTAPPCVDERLISSPPNPEAFSYMGTARLTCATPKLLHERSPPFCISTLCFSSPRRRSPFPTVQPLVSFVASTNVEPKRWPFHRTSARPFLTMKLFEPPHR